MNPNLERSTLLTRLRFRSVTCDRSNFDSGRPGVSFSRNGQRDAVSRRSVSVSFLAVAVSLGLGGYLLGQESPVSRGQGDSDQVSVAPSSRKLVVATRVVPPFVIRDAQGGYRGVTVELLRELLPDLRGDDEQAVTVEYREMGLAEMLSAVEHGQVDMAAAALTVSFDRERRIDFSHPYFTSGLGIAVIAGRGGGWSNVLDRLMSPAFLSIVGTVLLLVFVSGVLIYFAERRHNREQFRGGLIKGIGSGIWWAIVTLTTVGYGDKAPRTLFGRLMAVVWMLSGIIIISMFTAAVTAALTVDQLRSRISGPRDLPSVRVATVRDSTSEDYLRRRHIPAKRFEDVSSALVALRSKEVDAVVYDAPVLRYLAFQSYPGEIFVLPGTFERQDYAIALPSGSPLRELINQGILRTITQPTWEEIVSSYLGN